MCANEEVRVRVERSPESAEPAAFADCLVEGDASQRDRQRRVRRRSLIVSVVAQVAILAALLLVPILAKPERIALAKVMPLPPYRPARVHVAVGEQILRPVNYGFQFCPSCTHVAPRPTTPTNSAPADGPDTGFIDGIGNQDANGCSACKDLPIGSGPQPVAPIEKTPRVVHVTQIDPAMLLHRVEPSYPVLARQMRREGTVELRALIAEDGSVQSLEVLQGDLVFLQSALAAVRQWHYKPTILNGRAVEVDTHITVIYKLSQ